MRPEVEVRWTKKLALLGTAQAFEQGLDSPWFEAMIAKTDSHALTGGRGQVCLTHTRMGEAVIRHYRRGGWVARILGDRYWWPGSIEKTRVYREIQLLARLHAQQLPVPLPIGGRLIRDGLWYRADLITLRLANTRTLAECIRVDGFESLPWENIGAMVARFHAAGVDHADLNAHNILLDESRGVFVIDFDNGYIVEAFGPSARDNLLRLQRSLHKIARQYRLPAPDAAHWESFLHGYVQQQLQFEESTELQA